MKKNEEILPLWKKIITGSVATICIVAVILGVIVLIGNMKKDTVKIQLSSNREIVVLTAKTNVAEILKENNIALGANEKVIPSLDADITEDRIIRISLIETKNTNIIQNSGDGRERQNGTKLGVLSLLEAVQFEIIIEDVSDSSDQNANSTITQYGKIGLREVTYEVTYQDNIEIERKELSSKIIREPVDHIIRIETKTTVTASTNTDTNTRTGLTSLLPDQYVITAYCACKICCEKDPSDPGYGITASGTRARANHTIAASSIFAFGTQILINGIVYTVEDRGGAIQGNRIDIYMDTHTEALQWGVKVLPIQILYDIYGV